MGQTAAGTEHRQADAQRAVGQGHGLLDNGSTIAPVAPLRWLLT